ETSYAGSLSSSDDPKIRASATRALGEYFKTLEALSENADDTYAGRLSVIQTDQLPELANDKNPRVRLEALRALARIPTARRDGGGEKGMSAGGRAAEL